MIDYAVDLATIIAIQALLVLGLNFQFGLAGIVNFGYVALYALGAYSSAILTQEGVPILAAVLVGVSAAVLAGSVLGFATLRLREDYFAILTLGFAETLRVVLLNLRSVTRGGFGIPNIPRPLASLIPAPEYPLFYLVLVVVALALALTVCSVLAASPFGRTMRAIRDDDIAAMALGKNPFHFRMQAMILGAVIAAIAGSLWAHYVTFVVPDQFTAEITFAAWMAMIIGGIGLMGRSVVGAAILALLLEGSRFAGGIFPGIEGAKMAALRQVLIGLVMIALTLRESRRSATR